MIPAQVKVEKSDLETAKARTQLDAIQHCLLEKGHLEWERLDAEPGEPPSDTHKECSVTTTGRRQSALVPHQQRKKRREMGGGLTEGALRDPARVIKLFDQNVDLAQFSEGTPASHLPSLEVQQTHCAGMLALTQLSIFHLPAPSPRMRRVQRSPIAARVMYKLPPAHSPWAIWRGLQIPHSVPTAA